MGKRILVVEDDEMNLELIEDVLQMYGYKPYLAKDGVEALKKLNYIKPDLVLLDLRLPKMNGEDVLKLIKKRFKDLPVIAVTASVKDKEYLFRIGFDGFLFKPFRIDDLLKEIEKSLGGGK